MILRHLENIIAGKIFTSKFLFWNCVVSLSTMVVFALLWIPAHSHWLIGFAGYLIPLLYCLNLLFLFHWVRLRKLNFILSLATMVLCYPVITFTFQFADPSTDATSASLAVLSYNVNCFNSVPKDGRKSHQVFNAFMSSIIAKHAGVICLQEYCTYPYYESFNADNRFVEANYLYGYSDDNPKYNPYSTAGLAIYSMYPIIKKGKVTASHQKVFAIWADILFDQDTLRIYNTHFYSMGLINPNVDEKSNKVYFLEKLKTGFTVKNIQTSALITALEKCPHEFVLTGDFNEIPYSHTYMQFTKKYNNSFEKSGSGFGTTYNGTIPLLRIDHQFTSSGIYIADFQTLYKVELSDHFPVIGLYSIRK